MMDTTFIIITIVSIAGTILITRLLGAWMFRITEVIALQKEILNEMRRMRNSENEGFSSPKGFTKPPKSGKSGGLFQKVDPNRKPL